VITYLNDIFIFLKNEADYIRHMIQILKILEKSDIKINEEKYIFYFKEVEFLGYIFTLKDI
jgi:hypothetical protein